MTNAFKFETKMAGRCALEEYLYFGQIFTDMSMY